MYMFGVSNTKKTAKVVKINDTAARKHGGQFINTSTPIGGGRNQGHSWFEIPDYGNPHNRNTANAIYAEIETLSLIPTVRESCGLHVVSRRVAA